MSARSRSVRQVVSARCKEAQNMNREASKEEALKKIGDHAHQILLRSGNCAQTSFLVLTEQFEKEQGNTMCGAILEAKLGKRYNLANPIESALYFASGGPEKCAEVVASAVRIAAEIIVDKG